MDNSGFLFMHRMRLALSQVKALSWLREGSGIPSISTAYAQPRRRCAQVIHKFVHRQQGSSPVAWPGGSSRSARRCLRARPAGRVRGSGQGSYLMIAVTQRTGRAAARIRAALMTVSIRIVRAISLPSDSRRPGRVAPSLRGGPRPSGGGSWRSGGSPIWRTSGSAARSQR